MRTLSNQLFLFFFVQPLFLFQLVILIRFPSWFTFGILIITWVFNAFFIGSDSLLSVYSTRKSLFLGFLIKFRKCIYTRYEVLDYLKGKAYEKVGNLSHPAMIRKTPFVPKYNTKLKDFIRIYTVKKGVSNELPKQLAAYSLPFWGAYIFVRDEPEKTKTVAKFFICHEVGHILNNLALKKSVLFTNNKPLILFLIWSFFAINWTYESKCLVAILCLLIISVAKDWNNKLSNFKLEEEVFADSFALECMSVEEKEEIRTRFFNVLPPVDSSMSYEQNKIRKFYFEDALNNKPSSIINAFSIYPPFQILIIQVIILLLATYANEPTMTILTSYIIIGCIVFVFYAFMGYKVIRINEDIEYILNTPYQMSKNR